jgi:hypothetical protein
MDATTRVTYVINCAVNLPNQRMAQVQLYNHQLVSDRFLTPVDGYNMETHHINGVRWDNRVVNLQIITHDLNNAYARGMPIVAVISCMGLVLKRVSL